MMGDSSFYGETEHAAQHQLFAIAGFGGKLKIRFQTQSRFKELAQLVGLARLVPAPLASPPRPATANSQALAVIIFMKNTFDLNSYLKHVGEELIRNFSLAGHATTPSLVGGAREKATRQKLETLLPPLVGVGTGCIIDSYGNTSKQMDIVLYEKNLCPVFSINETPETTYYPCEGVIAVGEIKSSLNNSELADIFKKIDSVKSLRRHAVASKGVLVPDETVSFRHYGNTGAFEATKKEEFNQSKNRIDQIFCFAFCGELDAKPQTLLDRFDELRRESQRRT